jgi:hypothetical protein
MVYPGPKSCGAGAALVPAAGAAGVAAAPARAVPPPRAAGPPPSPAKAPPTALGAVARIELAATEPSGALVPWTIAVSPGWIAATALVAVRTTVAPADGVTLIVVPWLSVR